MGRFLGIDVGTRTLGLAVSDDDGRVALPLGVVRRAGLERDLAALRAWMEGRDISDVVVGLPLNLDGTPGTLAAEVDRVAEAIQGRFGVPVHRWDERMSTVAAERTLIAADVSRRRRRQVIDKLAATLILQAYLDRRAGRGGGQ